MACDISILNTYAVQPSVLALLELCVGRLASRPSASFAIEEEQLRHIADWLRASLGNDEPWLKNLDAQGRPKKLMKFGSIDAIVREADKAMLKAAQKLRGVKLVDGDEELVEMLADGYYVVRLLTPAALDRESAEMQHCIGNGGYDERLRDGIHEYLSLRDQVGRPHVTMEIENESLIQFQGKQNDVPCDRYRDILIPFIQGRKWRVEIPAIRLGYVVDVHGKWHSIHDLPDDLRVDSLDLSGIMIKKLPKALKVDTHLNLGYSGIQELPDDLTVGGALCLNYTDISSLPKNLKVGGDICLVNSVMTSLPEDLNVGKSFYLSGTQIQNFPKGLRVRGLLDLSYSRIRSLPECLQVDGDLYLRGTEISELPRGLIVTGLLDLGITQIKSLPDDIRAGDDVDLAGSEIMELPNGLDIKGSLYLRRCKIKNLPPGLRVCGHLYVEDSNITSLPEDIHVGGSVYVGNTTNIEIPDSILRVVTTDGPMDTADYRQAKRTSSNGR